jgi:hypothetical protein
MKAQKIAGFALLISVIIFVIARTFAGDNTFSGAKTIQPSLLMGIAAYSAVAIAISAVSCLAIAIGIMAYEKLGRGETSESEPRET